MGELTQDFERTPTEDRKMHASFEKSLILTRILIP
jgi:hypothetical protein